MTATVPPAMWLVMPGEAPASTRGNTDGLAALGGVALAAIGTALVVQTLVSLHLAAVDVTTAMYAFFGR